MTNVTYLVFVFITSFSFVQFFYFFDWYCPCLVITNQPNNYFVV